MKIGVLSDTHDQVEATARAIKLLMAAGAEAILHCGDIVGPDIVRLFSEIRTHFVLGNWDVPEELEAVVSETGAKLHGHYGDLTLAGRRIAWCHSHRPGQLGRLERAGEFDYLFYGHTHTAETHRTGKTTVANPGALQRTRVKTCLLVDLVEDDMRSIEVPRG